MTKLTIYYGAVKPMVAVGRNQCRLLAFAERHHGWHSVNERCRASKRAVKALEQKGYLRTNEHGQFAINYPS